MAVAVEIGFRDRPGPLYFTAASGVTWRYDFKEGRMQGRFAYDDKTLETGILRLLNGEYDEI